MMYVSLIVLHILIETAQELPGSTSEGCKNVGITAGASTPAKYHKGEYLLP